MTFAETIKKITPGRAAGAEQSRAVKIFRQFAIEAKIGDKLIGEIYKLEKHLQ